MPYAKIASVMMVVAALPGAARLALAGGTTTPPPPQLAGPTITQFTCEGGALNLWTFYGQVANPTGVANLTIEFDGISAINGQSVPVNPDGSFSLTIPVPAGQTGVVGAVLVDDSGAEYDEALTLVT